MSIGRPEWVLVPLLIYTCQIYIFSSNLPSFENWIHWVFLVLQIFKMKRIVVSAWITLCVNVEQFECRKELGLNIILATFAGGLIYGDNFSALSSELRHNPHFLQVKAKSSVFCIWIQKKVGGVFVWHKTKKCKSMWPAGIRDTGLSWDVLTLSFWLSSLLTMTP